MIIKLTENKHMKCILIYILVFIFFLTGCGGRDGVSVDDEVDINYSESIVKLPDDVSYISDFAEVGPNIIKAIGVDKTNTKLTLWDYDIKKDKWTYIESVSDKFTVENIGMTEVSGYIVSDDHIAVQVVNWKDNIQSKPSSQHFVLDKNGNRKNILTKKIAEHTDEDAKVFTSIDHTSSGQLIPITVSGKIYKTDKNMEYEGEWLTDLWEPFTFIYSTYENYLFGTNGESHEIIDIDNNKVIQDDTFTYLSNAIKNDFDHPIQAIAPKKKEINIFDYYYVNDEGIWLFTKLDGTNEKKKLLNSEGTQLGVPDMSIYKSLAVDSDTLLLSGYNQNGAQFIKYQKDDNVNKVDTHLTAYSLYQDDNIKQLLNSYMRENKNVEIKYKWGIENDKSEVSDVINKLNTKILSGDGPDLIFLDGMNIDSYANENMLENLNAIAETSDDSMFANMVEQYKYEGGINAIPCSFSYMTITGNKAIASNADSIESLLREAQKTNGVLNKEHFSNTAILSYKVYFEQALRNNKNITKEDIKTFYRQLKTLNKNKSKKPDKVTFNQENFNINPLDGYLYVADDKSLFSMDYIHSYSQIQWLNYLHSSKDLYVDTLLPNNGYYLPRAIISVSSKSDKKDEALDVVDYVISDAAQKEIGESDQLPVNKDIFKNILSSLDQKIHVDGHTNAITKVPTLSKSQQQATLKQLEKLSIGANTDNVLMEIVMVEAEKYLKGFSSLDKSAANALQKIKLYKDEQ